MQTNVEKLLRDDAALARALKQQRQTAVPAALTARLRETAARERARQIEGSGRWFLRNALRIGKERMGAAFSKAHLVFENVMRPLAVPALGGVFSAVTLFNLWVVPAYPLQPKSAAVDVPTRLTSEATFVDRVNVSSTDDLIVEVTIDEQGNVADCHILSDDPSFSFEERRYLETMLKVYGHFEPATSFGIPTVSKVRLQYSSIDVKG